MIDKPDLNLMPLIEEKLREMGYAVRSSVNSSNLWYATTDTKGELHAVIVEDFRVRVNDINGRHFQESQNIQAEMNQLVREQMRLHKEQSSHNDESEKANDPQQEVNKALHLLLPFLSQSDDAELNPEDEPSRFPLINEDNPNSPGPGDQF